MVTHLIQARYTKHCTLSVPSPHPAMCPPHWDRVPSPSGSKPVSNLSIFQGTQNYFARKREGAGGGWESHSISHLHHPSTRAWILSTHSDERWNSPSGGRRDLLSCFKCFAGCVYWPINYLSTSFNSISPGEKAAGDDANVTFQGDGNYQVVQPWRAWGSVTRF